MAKRKVNAPGGLVYSTDPDFKQAEEYFQEPETLVPSQQKLTVRLDKKHRAGKAVTIVEGFTGTSGDNEELGKRLKTFCGTGGSVKDREIIVQGDNRDKVLQWLQKNGYSAARKI
ncbi:MAG: translation initiation factor [Ferruginibacter sp.]